MLSGLIRQFVIGCFLLAMISVAAIIVVDHYLSTPLSLQTTYKFRVPVGSNITEATQQLAAEKIIRFPELFLSYARLSGQTAIKAGEYKLDLDDTPKSLLAKFLAGEVVLYTVTFPEGLTVKQWLQRLHGLEYLDLQQKNSALPFIEESAEGWLYPDTYSYQAGDTDLSILKQAYQQMKSRLEYEWESRADGLPYKNPYEALIMASIIEKETGVAHERAKIAGVFVRRLQKGMRLQTDPTVIYGLGDNYSGNLTRAHLRQKTPFNTYVIDGLPPTPIANPGGDAIHAALHPADGTELFFVAKGDGSHYFSTTLQEHQSAVNRYQKRRVKNYRSHPKE